jgi:hypothetical protein
MSCEHIECGSSSTMQSVGVVKKGWYQNELSDKERITNEEKKTFDIKLKEEDFEKIPLRVCVQPIFIILNCF